MGQQFSNPLPQLIAETSAIRLEMADRKARFSLRVRGDLSAMNAAIGVDLPAKIGTSTHADELEALCLGPDEWLLLLDEGGAWDLQAKLDAAYAVCPHSLVDISAREVTFQISGAKAIDLMSIGCPRDFAAIPVGEARRTVFDGATVVLWHDAETAFRMDVWCSFAPFVAALLATGATELALEMA